MSEIYLTKIERKTIFTKSLIFVLIMFIISDMTVTGPFWFNFIPWMFLVGTLASIKKIDSVLVSIIATFTVFISSAIMQAGVNLTCVSNTIITLATVVLGIITGRIIYEFILEHRLVKYIKRSKKITYIVLMAFMFLTSFIMVGLNSGNIITYLKSKNNLKQYITKTYNIDEYSIEKVQYVKNVPGKYVYKLNIEKEEVTFIPVTNLVFKDVNKENRLNEKLELLKEETLNKVQTVLDKYSMLDNLSATYKLEYNSVAINPDTTVLSLIYNSEVLDMSEQDKLYYELVSAIYELRQIKDVQKIIITINGKTLQLSYENIQNLTQDYLKGGFEIFEIEEISE